MKFTLIGAAVVVAAAFVAPVKFIRLRPGAQLFQHVVKAVSVSWDARPAHASDGRQVLRR